MNQEKKNMSSKFNYLLESDIAATLLPLLGVRDMLISYAPLTKGCFDLVKARVAPRRKGINSAKPVEKSGRLLSALLDTIRLVGFDMQVCSLTDKKIARMISETRDLSALRRSAAGMSELSRLNIAIYTYWDTTPATPLSGVYEGLLETLKLNEGSIPEIAEWRAAIQADLKYWKGSRAHGQYIVLFERPDGTVVVSKDCQRVYLVQGIAQSLAEVANIRYEPQIKNFRPGPRYNLPKLHSPAIGVIITTTLLNWKDNVVYDGIFVPEAMASCDQLQSALKAYLQAVEGNTLIKSLQKREEDVAVPSSGMAQQISNEVELLKIRFSGELNTIRTSRPFVIPPNRYGLNMESNELQGMWVFRRCGYSEEENPNHMVCVLCGGHTIVPFAPFQSLEPKMEEYIPILLTAVEIHGRPPSIAVDVQRVVAGLRELLSGCGIAVHYYPPPSPEEIAMSDATNPGLVWQRACGVCRAKLCPDGTPLLQCGCCKRLLYCSKEHQKHHWPAHKRQCKMIANQAASLEGMLGALANL